MTGEPKDLTILFTESVQQDIADDPAAAEALKDFCAKMRQAFDAVQRGQHMTIDEALNALGIYPKKFDGRTGEEIEGASLQDEMAAFFASGEGEIEACVERIESPGKEKKQ